MTNTDTSIRIAAIAIAAVMVAGSTYALGSYSDAKYAATLAAAEGSSTVQGARTAIAPVRIDVIGKRVARTAA